MKYNTYCCTRTGLEPDNRDIGFCKLTLVHRVSDYTKPSTALVNVGVFSFKRSLSNSKLQAEIILLTLSDDLCHFQLINMSHLRN